MIYPKEVTLHVGGVHASAEPTLIQTLLGSCVAVCLWDSRARVGGMNHILLPGGGSGDRLDEATRFGAHAMDRLIGEMLKLGAEPRRFAVKVFGGASVLALEGRGADVPRANVEFVRTFLAREGLRIVASSVGGTLPRQVRFFTDSGKVLVRRVVAPKVRSRVVEEEEQSLRRPTRFGDVTLF